MRKAKVSLPIIVGILMPSVSLVALGVAANTTGLTDVFARVSQL